MGLVHPEPDDLNIPIRVQHRPNGEFSRHLQSTYSI